VHTRTAGLLQLLGVTGTGLRGCAVCHAGRCCSAQAEGARPQHYTYQAVGCRSGCTGRPSQLGTSHTLLAACSQSWRQPRRPCWLPQAGLPPTQTEERAEAI
jgi:hypothetical protein